MERRGWGGLHCYEEAISVLSGYVAAQPDDLKGLYELGWAIQLSSVFASGTERTRQAIELDDRALTRQPSELLREVIESTRREVLEMPEN